MAVQQAQNVFTAGINKDLNPISQKNDTLTDALNATTITFNGNELLLQNDMGNTNLTYYPKIYNSKDGTSTFSPECKMVKLKDGYIPIGMKEFGDIVYIISHNPAEKSTEIGSFPGPDFQLGNVPPIDITPDNKKIEVNTLNIHNISNIQSETAKLEVGDKIEFDFKNIDNNHIISTSTEAKLLRPKFINFITGNDITDYLKFDFSQNKLTLFYPNVESGQLGLGFTYEEMPQFIFQGLANSKNLNTAPELEFNNIIIQNISYFKIYSFDIEYTLTDFSDSKKTGAYLNVGGSNKGKIYKDNINVTNGEVELPKVIIDFTNGYYNTVTFKAKLTPIIEIQDNNSAPVYNYIDEKDFTFSELGILGLDPIEIIWYLDKSIDSLSGESKTVVQEDTITLDYNNIVESRNINYDLDKYLHPKFISNPWQKGDFSNGGHYNNNTIYYLNKQDDNADMSPILYGDSQENDIEKFVAKKSWKLENQHFETVTGDTGGQAILAQHLTWGNQSGVDWSAEFTAVGTIESDYNKSIKTNLFGNLQNIIVDNSVLLYTSSDTNFGAVIYPGAPLSKNQYDYVESLIKGNISDSDYNKYKGNLILGYIGEWDKVGKRAVNYDLSFSYQLNGGKEIIIHETEARDELFNTTAYAQTSTRNRNKISTLLCPQEDIKIDCPAISVTANTFTINNITYKYKIKTWNRDYGEQAGRGTGTNGLIIFPALGSLQYSENKSINRPKLITDIQIKDYTLPPTQNIKLQYEINTILRDGNYYKLDNKGNILANQSEISYNKCLFYANGQIIENQLVNNTILYDKYQPKSNWSIYNIPNTRYVTVAYFTYAPQSNQYRLFKPGPGVVEEFYYDKIMDNNFNCLMMYLLDTNYDIQLNPDSQVDIVNPIIYSSSFAQYNKNTNTWNKINNPSSITTFDPNQEIDENKIYWIDTQVQRVEKLKVLTKKESSYYYQEYNPAQSAPKTSYITNTYYPDPIYLIKRIEYNT